MSLRSRESRPGFTLIELLVVIAIIGVLVALIMPAVQSARETANRNKCINNLKQLALAAQQYHDSSGVFQAGWLCDPNDPICVPQAAQNTMWNGIIGLLPYVEQQNLYRELNIDLSPINLANATALSRSINVFQCPSNPRQTIPTIKVPDTTRTIKVQTSDYRGNMAAGTLQDCTPITSIDCQIFDNGLHYQNSSIDIAAITDGTSNTFQFGEALEGTWAEATSCCTRTTIDRKINQPIQISGKLYNIYWSSKHPGLVNMSKVDGSVSSVKETINRQVLISLMTRAGGEAISGDALK